MPRHQRDVDAHAGRPRCHGLQVGPAFVHLQRHQGGVVVGAFKGWEEALGFEFGLGQGHGLQAAVARHHLSLGGQGGWMHHGKHGVFVGRETRAEFTFVIGGDAPLDGGDEERV